MSITVLTPTIEGREAQLAEACASVQAQTMQASDHRVWCDGNRDGPARVRNWLLAETETEYVAFLDDDDILYPDHLSVLAKHIPGADLAFSWHDAGPGVPRYDSWDASAYWTMRQGRNVIPVTVLAKTQSIREAGCFNASDRYEDYQLWLRMLDLGMRFVCAPVVTWQYRISDDGRTWNP